MKWCTQAYTELPRETTFRDCVRWLRVKYELKYLLMYIVCFKKIAVYFQCRLFSWFWVLDPDSVWFLVHFHTSYLNMIFCILSLKLLVSASIFLIVFVDHVLSLALLPVFYLNCVQLWLVSLLLSIPLVPHVYLQYSFSLHIVHLFCHS